MSLVSRISETFFYELHKWLNQLGGLAMQNLVTAGLCDTLTVKLTF